MLTNTVDIGRRKFNLRSLRSGERKPQAEAIMRKAPTGPRPGA
jgi:hypothetical protein